jgi:large subunit ribosomal protein L9
MKIILTETVQGLGEAGTMKEVADGYARNYLLPRKLAVVATRGSVKQAEAQADLYTRKANKAREEARGAAGVIEGKTVTIQARAGSENRLYGSVTPADIADALSSQYSLSIDRRKVQLAEPIHRLGTYTATADLGNGVTATFNVNVASEGQGAPAKSAAKVPAQPAAQEASSGAESETPLGDEAMDAGDAALENDEMIEEEAEANPS